MKSRRRKTIIMMDGCQTNICVASCSNPLGSSEFSDFLKLGISTASAATFTKRETTGKPPREAFAEAKTERERERERERRTHKDKHKMAAPRKRTLLKVIILGDSG